MLKTSFFVSFTTICTLEIKRFALPVLLKDLLNMFIYFSGVCIFTQPLRPATCNLHLMTERVHHWAFFHLEQISHFFTFLISSARFSGSDFITVSNSANLPGRKNTLVIPNLKSFSFNPRALNRACAGKAR